MYKGNLKIIVLKELSKKDMSGYSLMKSLAEATGKKPSPGSIYPLLDELRSNGLVSMKEEGRKKIYSLTKTGKEHAKEVSCKDELHQKFGQTVKMFCSLVDDKEMQQIKEMFTVLEDSAGKGDLNRFSAFKKEMLPLKMTLFSMIREGDKEKIGRARKILLEANGKLKKL